MYILANKSSFGARAISGAFPLPLCGSPVASVSLSVSRRKRR
jgi:hypothetical protein